jgi:hypothetical protein
MDQFFNVHSVITDVGPEQYGQFFDEVELSLNTAIEGALSTAVVPDNLLAIFNVTYDLKLFEADTTSDAAATTEEEVLLE